MSFLNVNAVTARNFFSSAGKFFSYFSRSVSRLYDFSVCLNQSVQKTPERRTNMIAWQQWRRWQCPKRHTVSVRTAWNTYESQSAVDGVKLICTENACNATLFSLLFNLHRRVLPVSTLDAIESTHDTVRKKAKQSTRVRYLSFSSTFYVLASNTKSCIDACAQCVCISVSNSCATENQIPSKSNWNERLNEVGVCFFYSLSRSLSHSLRIHIV